MYEWEVLSNNLNCDEVINKIIEKRLGNFSKDDFYNPPHPVSLLNPNFFSEKLFENIKNAKELIFEAIKDNTLILIHGDYDADGVCATTIISHTIKNTLNYSNCLTLIPDRFEDGYGLSDKTVKKLLELSFNQKFLLITVDCGISSVSQVAELKGLGNKIIITDHHHLPSVLPEADVIIWDDRVVGSTISWFLALGLGNKDPKFLALASVATVTDVFPLVGFNRSIIKHGLDVLRTSPPLAIETILDLNNKHYKDISVYDLGFVIGPRINSSGRIGSADTSLELMTADTREKAKELVETINEINLKRQKITEESVKELEKDIDSENLPKIVIIKNSNFHEGVMGLIASRIVQKYHRPALVMSNNEGKLKGSARSIRGINLIEILKNYSEEFISVGGHELAAGFSIEESNFENLKNLLNRHMEEYYSNFNFTRTLKIDSSLNIDMINYRFWELLNRLEPYGNGNEEPIFCIYNTKIKEIKYIGDKKNHLSLQVSDGVNVLKCLYFNFDKEKYSLFLGQNIDIAFKIRKNDYKGKINLDLHLVDIKLIND